MNAPPVNLPRVADRGYRSIDFGTFVTFASVNLSAIWLRIRKPEWERPFKTPVSIGKVPLIPLLGLLSSGLMVTQFRLDVIALSVFAILLGFATQRALARRRKATEAAVK